MTASIIVPCYNQAEFLGDALASVMKQSIDEWECIIVNDGSDDNTETVAKEWCSRDKRFSYISQRNAGVCAARNAGIRIAKGEFILPLDGDDKIHPDYCKDAVEAFKNNKGLTLVYADAEYFGTRTGPWQLPDYDYKSLLIQNKIYCSAMYRRRDWELVGGYDENIRELEDWEFWINLLHGEKKVYRIPVVRFYYRMHQKSRNLAILSNHKKKMETESYIFSKHQKIYEEYLGSMISNLHSITKLKNELARIKKGMAYKLSTKLVTLAMPLRRAVKGKSHDEQQ